MLRAGIDTGGTHTDVVILDDETGSAAAIKVPTRPERLTDGIFDGLERALQLGVSGEKAIGHLVYATTIVVNMIAQNEREKVGLITTRGFRDVLEIGRAYRSGNIYDIQLEQSVPLVPREFRYTVTERMDFSGSVVVPLDEAEVEDVARRIREAGLRTVAVCLLHAYRNPIHEQRIRDILRRHCPDLAISLSSEVIPQFREFERTSTTVINAFVMPRMVSHLNEFERELEHRDYRVRPFIMQANSGIMSFRSGRAKPVQVANSGPVAGVVAGSFLARQAGYPNIITMDIGGTSCDVALVYDGSPLFTSQSAVHGYPLSINAVDLHCIGAGGGSIAWVDAGGALQVGPRSAGALPGPVCYGLGGQEPTVTDANLVTGRLNPDRFLDGSRRLDLGAAERAIGTLARALGDLPPDQVAEGIVDVLNSNMLRAIKRVSAERGYDPREFALVSFGGAGGLHASALAAELDISTVIVPPSPGTFSALGTVLADVRYDHVLTKVVELTRLNPEDVEGIYEELAARAMADLEDLVDGRGQVMFTATWDMRYEGQGHELNVPVGSIPRDAESLAEVQKAFETVYERTYGHLLTGEAIEVVNFRLSAVVPVVRPQAIRMVTPWRNGAAPRRTRSVVYRGRRADWLVVDRSSLQPGAELKGPAIVEEMGSTTLVLPEQRCTVDPWGNLVLRFDNR